MADQEGGYESDFVEDVPARYICTICTKALRDPQLTVCCGQHYCQICLNKWLREKHECPHCRAQGPFVNNKDKNREIVALKVKCDNQAVGCEWIGELGDLDAHLESPNGCGSVEVECPNECFERMLWQPRQDKRIKMKRKDLDRHLSKECFNREYQCEHCGKRDKYVEITGKGSNFTRVDHHYKMCQEMAIQCPNECVEGRIKRKDIASHRAKCKFERVKCSNQCKVKKQTQDPQITAETVKSILRKDLDRHLQDECYLRLYKCEYCSLESTYEAITGNGIIKQETNHYQVCQEYLLTCPNKCSTDCIKRKDMEEHHSYCPEGIVPCPNNCHFFAVSIKRKNLNKHVKEECELRQYSCQHCEKRDTYNAITQHYTSCPNYPLECPNNCSATEILRKNVTIHCDECPLQPLECPFAEVGCKAKPVRQDLEKHTSTMQEHHLLMVMGTYKGMKEEHKTEMTQIEQTLRQTREEVSEAKTKLTQTQRELTEVNARLTTTEQQLIDLNQTRKGFFR